MTSSTIHGAASLRRRGPIRSVPVALLMSMLERNFETVSFLIGGMTNFVSPESFAPQNSYNLSWFVLVTGSFNFDAMFTKKSLNSFAIPKESSMRVSSTFTDPIVEC